MKIFRGYIVLAALLISAACALRAQPTATMPEPGTPVRLTAEDLMTKIYGVFSPGLSGESLSDGCKGVFGISPVHEDSGMWLDSDNGYSFSYFGIIVPEVSAVALTEGGSVAGCGYFFIFPYDPSTRGDANRQQALFCGNLLQEMNDMGMALSAALPWPGILFAVCGTYRGNAVEMHLSDEPSSREGGGRYVLYMSVRYAPQFPVSPGAEYALAER